MFQNELLNRISQRVPVTVMARALLENVLNPDTLDGIFQRHNKKQRIRKILFSFIVGMMLLVACKIRPKIHTAYKASPSPLSFTVDALYDKIAGVEIPVAEALVSETSRKMVQILRETIPPQPELIPGYPLRIVDGNKIAATDRRRKALREQDAAPLPGFGMVVFEPAWNLITHTILCRDGHAQERSLFPQLVKLVEPGDLWMEDRNFCCWTFLHGVISRNAFVLVRQHAGSIRWKTTSELVFCGMTETGEVWEQSGYVEDVDTLEQLPLRRIELRLNEPTRDGDTVLGLLTNLPPEVSAIQVADAYPKRWQIETAFQEIESLLSGEINTLSYPEAALFSLSCAYVAFNILQCVRLTLEASHAEQREAEQREAEQREAEQREAEQREAEQREAEQREAEQREAEQREAEQKKAEQKTEISLYYIADEVSHTWRGFDMLELPDSVWDDVRVMSPKELSLLLRELAMLVQYRKYTKRRSSSKPKKGPAPRSPTKRKGHASTARLLDNNKKSTSGS